MTEAGRPGRGADDEDPIERFITELGRLRGDASLRQLKMATGIPHSTWSDWFTTKRVVDWDRYEPLLRHRGVQKGSAEERSLKGLWREAHTAYQARLGPARRIAAPPPGSIGVRELPRAEREPETGPPHPWKRAAAIGISVAVAAVLALVFYVVFHDDTDSPTADDELATRLGRRGTGWIPTATTTFPGGPTLACPPVANDPDSTAEAEDRIAYAEYYRKHNLFVLYDNSSDGRSAYLELNIPGVLSHADWFYSHGWTCYGPRHPLPMIVLPNLLRSRQTIRYRVCVGAARDHRHHPPEDCGPWKTDRP